VVFPGLMRRSRGGDKKIQSGRHCQDEKKAPLWQLGVGGYQDGGGHKDPVLWLWTPGNDASSEI